MSDAAPKRVLIVGREEIIVVLARHILTRQGYFVDVALDLRTLNERLRAISYDAILLDEHFAGEEWLRGLPVEISSRIVIVTGDSESVKATIRKPIELDALAGIVDDFLRLSIES